MTSVNHVQFNYLVYQVELPPPVNHVQFIYLVYLVELPPPVNHVQLTYLVYLVELPPPVCPDDLRQHSRSSQSLRALQQSEKINNRS